MSKVRPFTEIQAEFSKLLYDLGVKTFNIERLDAEIKTAEADAIKLHKQLKIVNDEALERKALDATEAVKAAAPEVKDV